jgi:YidC/Oxa1 family membrane protein insertase
MRATFSPFILMSQVNALKNILLYPEMDKYREDMSLAYRTGNKAKIEAVNNYFKELKFKYKINNSYSIFTMAQVPFIIYFFWTLQDMTYNVDIYPAMTTDGFLWFKDLSEADPYFALPVMFACSTFWAIHKSPNSAQSIGPMSKYLKYLKYFVFLGIPVTSTFPAAIVLNWTMMSVFQMTINSLVYSRIGRKILKIPQYLPGSILEKHNTRVTSPVLKPKVFSHKPSLPKK